MTEQVYDLDILPVPAYIKALSLVQVSKHVKDALLNNEGDFAKVLEFIKRYEDADWTEVSRQLVLENIDMDKVYEAYLNALKWYRDLIPQK